MMFYLNVSAYVTQLRLVMLFHKAYDKETLKEKLLILCHFFFHIY